MKLFVVFQLLNFIVMTFVFVSLVNAQDNFRGIVPFVTTREEVEKKIGKPSERGYYEFDEGRVYIQYRENECPKIRVDCFCLAPLGTVLEVSIQPYYDLYLKDLKIDFNLFEKSEVKGHVSGIMAYINWKAGILYEVRDDERLSRIEYFESERTCKMLERKNSQTHDHK